MINPSFQQLLYSQSLDTWIISSVEGVDNQKAILLGAAIGFSAMCAVIIFMEGPLRGLPLPVPPMIATGIIAALSFWSRWKLK